MAKFKQPEEKQSEKRDAFPTFEIDTQYGKIKACKHTFNGKTFVHRELLSSQLESIGELLIESDIFSSVKSDEGGLNFDVGMVISHLIRKKLVGQFFAIILTHEDGSATTPEEFVGRLTDYVTMLEEVIGAFFTLNPLALPRIGKFLGLVLGLKINGGQLIAMSLAGRS